MYQAGVEFSSGGDAPLYTSNTLSASSTSSAASTPRIKALSLWGPYIPLRAAAPAAEARPLLPRAGAWRPTAPLLPLLLLPPLGRRPPLACRAQRWQASGPQNLNLGPGRENSRGGSPRGRDLAPQIFSLSLYFPAENRHGGSPWCPPWRARCSPKKLAQGLAAGGAFLF